MKYFGKKKVMKLEFRLLNDIIAKSLTAKSGYFDAFTLVAMMSTLDKQHQGYAVHIYYPLHKIQASMEQSNILHALKVLN